MAATTATPQTMRLLVEIDGAVHPLADCRWVRIEPNDCVTGSLVGNAVTSPQHAAERFTTSKRERAREERAGVRYQLVTPDRWATHAKPCLLGDCAHEWLA
ncbi:hypothetical protein [Kitasatospora sp. NPDC001175]|uniref:hypothetical protein n=1 Tax=Kitasatospora sp. NPDC001175 TaxID=3157103 RepID=UPI003D0598F2